MRVSQAPGPGLREALSRLAPLAAPAARQKERRHQRLMARRLAQPLLVLLQGGMRQEAQTMTAMRSPRFP
jgi:hypothetical protein